MGIKRKQYVVDRKFQLGTTFTIIGVIFIIVALISGLTLANAVRNNQKLAQIVDVQDNIVQALIAHTSVLESETKGKTKGADKKVAPEDQIELHAIASDHYSNIEDMKKMVKYNTYLLIAVAGILILHGIVLFFVLILKTHRIAGPIFVMSMYLRQMIDGKIPENLRPLRKKDEFKEFYSLFCAMVETMRSKAGKGSLKAVTKKTAVKKARSRR